MRRVLRRRYCHAMNLHRGKDTLDRYADWNWKGRLVCILCIYHDLSKSKPKALLSTYEIKIHFQ